MSRKLIAAAPARCAVVIASSRVSTSAAFAGVLASGQVGSSSFFAGAERLDAGAGDALEQLRAGGAMDVPNAGCGG